MIYEKRERKIISISIKRWERESYQSKCKTQQLGPEVMLLQLLNLVNLSKVLSWSDCL